MPKTVLLVLAALSACGGDDEVECRFDIDCPVLERCASGRCEPVQQTARDAAVGWDASAGLDAATERDSGADAGIDASVPGACELVLASDVSVDVGQGTDDAPVLVRSGIDLFGVVYRAPDRVMARFLDPDGDTIGEARTLAEGASPNVDLALTADGAGMLLAAWVDSDARIHGATADGVGVEQIDLTEPATGTYHPALAWTGAGFVLAWGDLSIDGETEQIWTLTLDSSGRPLENQPVRHVTPGRARLPALAAGDDTGVPIAWQDMRSGTALPYAGLRAADGSIEETPVSEAQLARAAALVRTSFGVFASWVEPAVDGGEAVLHVTRGEDGVLTDHEIERAAELDPRTSIAWDERMLLVGWQTGAGDAAQARVDAVSLDFQSRSMLDIGLGTAAPRVAADDAYRGVVWVDASTGEVRFGALACALDPEK
ncbi:MAG: hypothetical protein HYY06_01615 [Deltaproteobacteria bacterium]|nr:hypothetical protein [Deltaproteobacteria bacterium]